MSVPKNNPVPLVTEHATAFADPKLLLLSVTYQGVSSPTVVSTVYGWIIRALETGEMGGLRGSIFDFRQVTGFAAATLSTVQRKSQTVNSNMDLSMHPVALVVDGLYQEQMVRVAAKVTPGELRKRIVKSEQEALAFINEWNEQHNFEFAVPKELLMVWPETPSSIAAEQANTI